MAGLKLQYLSNPSGSSPSFIFGNPQKGSKKKLARKGKARENKKTKDSQMSKKRRRKSKKNPIVTYASKGGKVKRLGASASREERLAHVKSVLALRKRLRGPLSAGHSPQLLAKGKKLLRKAQKRTGKFKSGAVKHAKKYRSHQKAGYIVSASHETPKTVALLERREAAARRKAARKRKFSKKKVKTVAKPKKRKKRKSSKKNRMPDSRPAGKGGKARRMLKRRKKRKSSKRKTSKRKGRKARKAKTHKRKRKSRKVKKGVAPKKRRKSRRKASKASTSKRKRRSSKRAKRSGKRKSPKRRKHTARKRKTGKRRAKKHGFKRNPVEGIKNMGSKVMDLLNKLTGGEAANVPYIAAASVGNEVAGTLFNTVLRKFAPGLRASLASVNPALPVYVLPVVPGLAVAFACSKSGNAQVKKLGQAAGLVTLINLVQSFSAMVSGPAMKAAGLSGVDFTPRAMSGVDFTMGAFPRGLRGIPRGLRGVDFTRGMKGLTSRDRSDFGAHSRGDWINSPGGTLKTNADFGRQMADFGAVPSMRGAHTGDRMYADAQPDETGDDSDNPDESDGHTV